jgi:hypothetical protein
VVASLAFFDWGIPGFNATGIFIIYLFIYFSHHAAGMKLFP